MICDLDMLAWAIFDLEKKTLTRAELRGIDSFANRPEHVPPPTPHPPEYINKAAYYAAVYRAWFAWFEPGWEPIRTRLGLPRYNPPDNGQPDVCLSDATR